MSWQIYDFGASGTTLIDGANIYTGSILGTSIKANEITGNHIKAGAIATSHLAFSLVGSDNVVATINASTEGIKINAAKLTLTGLLQVGGAAADINAGATTIDGGKITADSLDATKIKAASITTDKLAVGTVQRDNLLTNGHFGTYNTYGDNYRGWTLVSGTFVPANGTYRPGGTTTDLWVPRISASVTNSLQLLSQRVTVVPGRTYTLAGMLYHTAGRAGIRVWAVGGNELSNTWSAGVSAGTNVPTFYQNSVLISNGQASSDVAYRWNLYAYRVTIPNGVTQVDIQICAWLTGDVNVYPGFIQFYDDDINEATGSMDLVNQMKNVAFGGDIQGNYTSIAVRGLQGRLVSSAAPSHAHVLGWHSTNNQWQSLPLTDWLGYTPTNRAGDTITGSYLFNVADGEKRICATGASANWGLFLTSGGCGLFDWANNRNILNYNAATNTTSSSGQISATQFNGSGAGLTGVNASQVGGVAITDIPVDTTSGGYKMDWSTRAPRSGFYEASPGAKTNLPVATGTNGYMHIINCQHSNGGNNFALQIASSFGPGGGDNYSDLFWRVTNNNGARPWYTIVDSNNIGSYTAGDATKVGGIAGFSSSTWAGGAGYPGYTFNGGNSRFGFSATGGVCDVYSDGNFYATDNAYLVIHAGNIGSQSVAYANYAGYLADGAQNGRASFASNVNGGDPSQAAIEIREYNRIATGAGYDGSAGQAPTIGFHWGGITFAHFGLDSGGTFNAWNYNRSGNANLRVATLYFGNLSLNGNGFYGIYGPNGFFDTINSGEDSDPLQLCYSKGSGVIIGNGGGKYIRAGISSNFGGSTTNGHWAFSFEGATFRSGTDSTLVVRRDNNSGNGLNGFLPAILIHNGDGGNQTTTGIAFTSAEAATGAGNSCHLAGIIAKKEIAGDVGSWSAGSLTLYVNDKGTRRDVLTCQRNGDTNMSGAASAWGYRGNANVGGTGSASYHPDGLYTAGANSWLYGNIFINNSICDNSSGRMQLKASGELYSSPNGTASDPYGCHSVTNPANSNNYGYYGMTRYGTMGWMLGITTNNEFVVGTGTGNGSQSIITSGALYVNHGGKVTAGTGFCIMDGNTALTRGISYATRITTPSGWVDIGPQNTSWCHFSTDRAGFYFGSRVEINGDLCSYSNQNWRLRDRGTGGTLRLKDTTNGQFYELYVENGVLKLILV